MKTTRVSAFYFEQLHLTGWGLKTEREAGLHLPLDEATCLSPWATGLLFHGGFAAEGRAAA